MDMHHAFSNMLHSTPSILCILEVLLDIRLGCIYGFQRLKPDPELQEPNSKLVHIVYPKCAKVVHFFLLVQIQLLRLEIPMDRGAWWATVYIGSQRVRHD